MSAWATAVGVVLLYNVAARLRGKPYACSYVRALGPARKAAAAVGYGWLGCHLFLRKGNK